MCAVIHYPCAKGFQYRPELPFGLLEQGWWSCHMGARQARLWSRREVKRLESILVTLFWQTTVSAQYPFSPSLLMKPQSVAQRQDDISQSLL